MSQVLEEIIEDVHALPPGEQQQVRDLVTMFGSLLLLAGVVDILSKMGRLGDDDKRRLGEVLNRELHLSGSDPDATERARRAALSRTVRGKYAHLGASSADFAARKAEEIALEDRRSRP